VKNTTVTVVVVNYNCGSHIEACMTHLLRQTFKPTSILLVDNRSTDGSAEKVPKSSDITLVKLRSNLGFAEANNKAFEICKTEYVALLNPDAFPEDDWLENLVSAAVSNPNVAAFGSCQVINDMPDKLDGTGDVYHISGLVWRNGHGHSRGNNENGGEIFSPCACASLYRRDKLVEAGGMDGNYFCYIEDVDLGFRLRLLGYNALYVPSAVVRHVGSASAGGHHSDFAVYHGHRNIVLTFVKNMPGFLFWYLLPLHILLNILTIIYFSLKGKMRVILKAKLHAFFLLPTVFKLRKEIQGRRNVSIRNIWKHLDKRILPLP
jgi:GT2 family glycosyltransferase